MRGKQTHNTLKLWAKSAKVLRCMGTQVDYLVLIRRLANRRRAGRIDSSYAVTTIGGRTDGERPLGRPPGALCRCRPNQMTWKMAKKNSAEPVSLSLAYVLLGFFYFSLFLSLSVCLPFPLQTVNNLSFIIMMVRNLR